MTDMAAISHVLSSIKAATDIAKLLKETDLSLEKAETRLKLAELVGSLADAKLELAEVQNLIIGKDETIKKLEQALITKLNIVYQSPCYWSVEGEKKDGPFCQQCYDKNRELIRLQDSGGCWTCLSCRNLYEFGKGQHNIGMAETDCDHFFR